VPLSLNMADEPSGCDTTDVFDVFILRHAQSSTFEDCLRRVLLCVGGLNGENLRVLKVAVTKQHGLEVGSSSTPCPCMEHEARTSSVGGHRGHQRRRIVHALSHRCACDFACGSSLEVYSLVQHQCRAMRPCGSATHFVTQHRPCLFPSDGVACAAVVVLSPGMVHGQQPQPELQVLLGRTATRAGSISIIPVFIGLTEEQCGDVEGLHRSQPWPQGVPQPSEGERAESLGEWAAAIEQLSLLPTVARSEQVRGCMNDRGRGEGYERSRAGLACRTCAWAGMPRACTSPGHACQGYSKERVAI
jgi:hypothetical protein